MKIRIRDRVDCEAGAFFLVIGLTVAALSTRYPYGTALSMGPGFFPLGLGILLSLLGGAILIRGLLAREERTIASLHLRQLIVVTLSICLFAIVLMGVGLLVAVPLMVFAVLAAAPGYSPKVAIGLAVSLTVLAYLIFHVALDLRIPLLFGVA